MFVYINCLKSGHFEKINYILDTKFQYKIHTNQNIYKIEPLVKHTAMICI